MPDDAPNDWLSLCPQPRPRPDNFKWDVFLSYRSVNRPWVLALYDTIVQAGFEVFLDQFELVPGASLDESLQDNLQASSAGILVWSDDAGESEWVKREHRAMRILTDRRSGEDLPFLSVVAKLDDAELPLLLADSLWVDFAPYPEGPRGGELLRLIHGIVGEPLSSEAVRAIARLDAATKDAVSTLRAAVNDGFPDEIAKAARTGGEAWNSTAMLASEAAEGLNALGEYDLALEVIGLYKERFDRSIRLQHMEALAYRRTDRYREALKVLGKLYADGHRDPETLGLYGASSAKRYEESNDRSHLETSQRMYAEAFAADPTDFYTGINAASKAALLGLGAEVFQPIASRVAALPAIQNPDKSDYWALATAGEAKLLALEVDAAVAGYTEAAARHSEQKGSIGSTKDQLEKLLAVIDLQANDKERLLASLGG
jgi:tetratricopeptide (TPR) repeat protein